MPPGNFLDGVLVIDITIIGDDNAAQLACDP
jgi:hypothetical protein